MTEPVYDSTLDTLEHIQKVRDFISIFNKNLFDRAHRHDQSKLGPDEKPYFDAETPKLKELVFGSDEYKASLERMKPALTHHYYVNDHHPEHFDEGIAGMDLFQLVEMWCDWCASSQRNSNGTLKLKVLKDRFGIDDQLYQILYNTAVSMRMKYET